VKARIFMVPEDRRKNGIIAGDTIRQNVLLPIWDRLAKPFFIDDKRGVQLVSKFIDDLNIRTTSMEQTVLRLSGGNQQKVVFAKCLSTEPQILLLDDPTVGVDIGTRKEIAQITRRLADQGNGVLLVSSEMEELAEQCDRILVMNRGEIIQEIDCSRQVVTEESLMHAIQGTTIVA
jgi:ribose transport system ATP-binding protein